MKAMDTEAQALIGVIKHHNNHDYRSNEARSRNQAEIDQEYKRLSSIPVAEFSESVWDQLDGLYRGE